MLKRDVGNQQVGSLCLLINETYQIECYPVAKALLPHVEHIYVSFKNFSTKYMNSVWDSKFSEAGAKETPLTYEDVVTQVWEPVIEDCSSMLEMLKTRKMKLIDIDTQFKEKYADKQELDSNLHLLCKVIHICSQNGIVAASEWVEGVSSIIYHYWELCACIESGKALLEVRDRLKLSGDFGTIEKIVMLNVS